MLRVPLYGTSRPFTESHMDPHGGKGAGHSLRPFSEEGPPGAGKVRGRNRPGVWGVVG